MHTAREKTSAMADMLGAMHYTARCTVGEVTTGDDGGGLVVDAALEAGGAPVDELDGALGLGGGDSGVDVLWVHAMLG
jgi:hypothetical protein